MKMIIPRPGKALRQKREPQGRKGFLSLDAKENIRKIKQWDNRHEPRHDKTNKMSVRPAKTQISPGIRPNRSESSLALSR